MPELYPQDQQKVDQYLSSNVNQVERKPFKPFMLLGLVFVILGVLTVASYWVAISHGVI